MYIVQWYPSARDIHDYYHYIVRTYSSGRAMYKTWKTTWETVPAKWKHSHKSWERGTGALYVLGNLRQRFTTYYIHVCTTMSWTGNAQFSHTLHRNRVVWWSYRSSHQLRKARARKPELRQPQRMQQRSWWHTALGSKTSRDPHVYITQHCCPTGTYIHSNKDSICQLY